MSFQWNTRPKILARWCFPSFPPLKVSTHCLSEHVALQLAPKPHRDWWHQPSCLLQDAWLVQRGLSAARGARHQAKAIALPLTPPLPPLSSIHQPPASICMLEQPHENIALRHLDKSSSKPGWLHGASHYISLNTCYRNSHIFTYSVTSCIYVLTSPRGNRLKVLNRKLQYLTERQKLITYLHRLVYHYSWKTCSPCVTLPIDSVTVCANALNFQKDTFDYVLFAEIATILYTLPDAWSLAICLFINPGCEL